MRPRPAFPDGMGGMVVEKMSNSRVEQDRRNSSLHKLETVWEGS